MDNYRKQTNNILLLALLLRVRARVNSKKVLQTRRYWVRDILKKRKTQGAYHNLIQEMRLNDPENHFNYLRMSKEKFEDLLSIVGPKLTKDEVGRDGISAAERLALTIRFLASGDSMVSISYAFRIGKSTTSHIIRETCTIIWECMNETVLLTPKKSAWKKIADNFEERWNLPNCIGALDGKHGVLQALPHSGSTYYNYKGSHSIVLLALCDSKYKFTIVDIGAPGRHSDGGVFRHSRIGQLLQNNGLDLPTPSAIEYAGDPVNYYIAADEAFPLTCNIMRPYPGRYLHQSRRIFNYRLSRGRRTIENTFGILAGRWRIFRKPIIASLPTAKAIIEASVCLHNWLMTDNCERYCPQSYIDREDCDGEMLEGAWRREVTANNLLPINRIGTNMHARSAYDMREKLTSYFLMEGAVDFQWSK